MLIVIIAILVVCLTVIVCIYLKTHETRAIVFENSGYEKRIRRLEKEMERVKSKE